MIVYEDAHHFHLVTQPDHAHLAGELLSLWRSDGLPQHPRREALLFAAREHDNGWREADSAPHVDRVSRKPHDFRSIPEPLRLEIWDRGTLRFVDERPLEALLITQYALRIHRRPRRLEDEGWKEFVGRLEERREQLLESTRLDPESLEKDYRWLAITDLLSLVVCNRWREPVSRHGWTAHWQDDALVVDPFPLAGVTTFTVPLRKIPHRPYTGDADLGSTLAAARWQEMEVRVRPQGPPTSVGP